MKIPSVQSIPAVKEHLCSSDIHFACRASIRQRSRSQLSSLIPDSVSFTGDLGLRAYSLSQADKSKVCADSSDNVCG